MNMSMDTETVETPILAVDKSQTIEERLTNNVVDNILPARYLLRDEDGNTIEEPTELFTRVADNVAKAEDTEQAEAMWADEFEHLMSTLQFMPNSPTLMNAGAPLQQLSACFVDSPTDSMSGIFQTNKEAAQILKTGGGIGYTFSRLRPKGALVESTGGVSSGPISFMEVFDSTCGTIMQGGKRRGAMMAILRCDHADVGRFAVAKRMEGKLSNFNISVAYTDEFEQAIRDDTMYTFYDPETEYEEPFEVVKETAHFYSPEFKDNPENSFSEKSGELVDENIWRDYADEIECSENSETVTLAEKWEGDSRIHLKAGEKMELPAQFIFDILIDGAWRNGEPGLFHIDEANREHTFDVDEHPEHKMISTNPCQEQPLEEYESCTLGHVNLSLMLEDEAPTYETFKRENELVETGDNHERLVNLYLERALDYQQLNRVVSSGTRFLDNVLTMNDFPLEEIRERADGQRKIGLGIMGFAQMLYQMGIPYGSKESYAVAEQVMAAVDKKSVDTSHNLAKERGAFDYWDESKYANPTEYPDWFERHTHRDPAEWEDGFPMRNHNTTTIAPTGTTSMIANTSGGCEPVYNVANFKNVGDDIQGDDMLVEFDEYFLRTLEANGLDVDRIKNVAEEKMRNNTFSGIEDLPVPEKMKEIFVTTQDLKPEQHIRMQRAFQSSVDSSISKTVNAPNDHTREDVKRAFLLAISDDEPIGRSVKGTTYYRDGSRDEQVLTTRVDNNLDENEDVIDEDTLAELHAEDEISADAMARLGYDRGDTLDCPDCDDGELMVSETCKICLSCGYSPCN